MVIKRDQTCCFTGHRPEKLPWGTNEFDRRCVALKIRIQDAAEAAYHEKGIRRFYCGMARGCDLYFAEEVLELREDYPDLELFAVLPCLTQAQNWPPYDQSRWQKILDACNHVMPVQETYSPGCMMRRNRYMVDHSALLIAAYSGQSGGTMRTVEYAMRKKIDILDICIPQD